MVCMCNIEVINGIKEFELFDMVPMPQEKWLRRAIQNEEEAEDRELVYEEGLQAFVDPWADWTRQEERLIEQQIGFGLLPEEVNHDKSDWPRVNKKANGIMVIEKIEGFYMSHLESINPYYAGAYPMRSNPDREQLLHDNRVVRKHVDQISTYMGNPTYNGKDRLIYTDIYGHIDSLSVHIRITGDVTNIDCARIDTPKGSVKVVNVQEGYIGWLDMDTIANMTDIPLINNKITDMFDDNGNALSISKTVDKYDIKGCNIEQSYLMIDDVLFDNTRMLKEKAKRNNTNKFIQLRIQSLRKRINKTVMDYKRGYISEQQAEHAVKRFKHAIQLQEQKMIV